MKYFKYFFPILNCFKNERVYEEIKRNKNKRIFTKNNIDSSDSKSWEIFENRSNKV